MNGTADLSFRVLSLPDFDASEMHGLAAYAASEEFAEAWMGLLRVFRRRGANPFHGQAMQHIAYFATEQCQALLPAGSQYRRYAIVPPWR